MFYESSLKNFKNEQLVNQLFVSVAQSNSEQLRVVQKSLESLRVAQSRLRVAQSSLGRAQTGLYSSVNWPKVVIRLFRMRSLRSSLGQLRVHWSSLSQLRIVFRSFSSSPRRVAQSRLGQPRVTSGGLEYQQSGEPQRSLEWSRRVLKQLRGAKSSLEVWMAVVGSQHGIAHSTLKQQPWLAERVCLCGESGRERERERGEIGRQRET